MPRKGISPAHLANIRGWAEIVREEAGDDQMAFLDTLDGETDALDVLDGLLEYLFQQAAMAKSQAGLIERYQLRKKATEGRIEAVRDQIAKLLDAMGEKSIQRPAATVSLRKGQQRLIGEGVDGLGHAYVISKTTTSPNKKAIRAAIEGGEPIDGWSLDNAPPSLTVR